jgi:molecular chaperone GrpE (heat shock protein)
MKKVHKIRLDDKTGLDKTRQAITQHNARQDEARQHSTTQHETEKKGEIYKKGYKLAGSVIKRGVGSVL